MLICPIPCSAEGLTLHSPSASSYAASGGSGGGSGQPRQPGPHCLRPGAGAAGVEAAGAAAAASQSSRTGRLTGNYQQHARYVVPPPQRHHQQQFQQQGASHTFARQPLSQPQQPPGGAANVLLNCLPLFGGNSGSRAPVAGAPQPGVRAAPATARPALPSSTWKQQQHQQPPVNPYLQVRIIDGGIDSGMNPANHCPLLKCTAACLPQFECRRCRRPQCALTTAGALAWLAWGSTPPASLRCIQCQELPAQWPRQQRLQQLEAREQQLVQVQRRQVVLHQPPVEGTCSLASPTACHQSTRHAPHACWQLAPPCRQPLSSSSRLGHHTPSSHRRRRSSSTSLLHGRPQTRGTHQDAASSRCRQVLPLPPALTSSHLVVRTC